MTKSGAELFKLTADVGTGVTIGEATDSSSLIITAVTILARLIIEAVINRRVKKAKKE